MRCLIASCLLFAAFGLTACGEDTGPLTPIDMAYNAQGVASADNCLQPPPTTPSRYTVDFLQRPDGLMQVLVVGYWTPGPYYFTAVARYDGQIDHVETVDGQEAGTVHQLLGKVNDERIELSLISDYRNADGSTCRYELGLKGKPRQFHNDKNLEGWFRVQAKAYAYTCDLANPGQPVFDAYTIADLDPDNASGLGRIGLVDNFYFSYDPPDKQGLTGWKGTVTVIDGGAAFEYLGSMTGTLKPDDLDMTMVVTGSDSQAGCGVLYQFKGKKTAPAADGPDGEYRIDLKQSGTCYGEFTSEQRYGTATAVSQPDGSVALYLEGNRVLLKPENGVYRGRLLRSFTGGQVNYEATFKDASLDLTVTLDEESFLGKCAYTTKVSGQKRFLPPPAAE